jgi:uncharacterized protein affecting Mg2+/Co2+ transport
MTNDFIFDFSLSSNNRFLSIYNIQIYELSDDAHKDIESYHKINKKKKKKHKEEK